ncbi:MAG: hypothetical protein COV46_05265 [Deltaproteobacteria bacterium CG11_big_fil_rev_8_21_14_0_20_49_13]|nr:MAG: hypothetical protein COV46_05265 [Deltaproteobacteria bacterium CG11_big_fil_rev_8_21_14_0_20_49_13]
MKKILIATCAMFALTVAGRAIAEEGHKGHMRGHDDAKAATQQAAAYKCPNHQDVTSATPAKCPKCGMEMSKMDGYNIKYRCPMHKDVVADKPGKCKECGMALEKAPEEHLGIHK